MVCICERVDSSTRMRGLGGAGRERASEFRTKRGNHNMSMAEALEADSRCSARAYSCLRLNARSVSMRWVILQVE